MTVLHSKLGITSWYYHLTAIIILLVFSTHGSAQTAVKELRAGNKLFEKNDYKAAEINYRKALENQNNYQKALFNLGD
ncbi:MAG TPA: hypothetical protein PLT47_11110, partial [Bacteroidales bacterium]|nr:hypothetical protein [Bacteroidales bacterium]